MPALRTRDPQPRSLDVMPDAAPAFAVLAPTPRAFSFPATHNLSAASPFSSPSSSPFEPDREPADAFPAFHPYPAFRPASPDSLRSSSPTPSFKRRKSSAASDTADRRPKKGDDDYIKRPENAFILFRRKCCEDRQQAQDEAAQLADGPLKKQRQADLSKTISQQWKSLSSEERVYWENLAKAKKKEHEQLYPNYVYRPQRHKDKDGRARANKKPPRGRADAEEASVSFVVPVGPPHARRSASAPTPPPYQAIRIPQVYHLTPSAPNSPSLIPMITRQSSSADFDFMSSTAYVAPPFQHEHMYSHRKPGPSPLQQLIASDLVSPASSVSSGSSAPSSPSGPFTPSTTTQTTAPFDLALFDFGHPSQAELDLQAEMQLQHDFSQFTWDWPDVHHHGAALNAGGMLDNNWDVDSIPSACLGEQALMMPCGGGMHHKYHNHNHNGDGGIEFGQDFAQALEGGGYGDVGLLGGYDDLMAGSAFAAAA